MPLKKEEQKKPTFSVTITAETLDKVREVVYYTPGLTMSSFAEGALKLGFEELEKNGSSKFLIRALRAGKLLRTKQKDD